MVSSSSTSSSTIVVAVGSTTIGIMFNHYNLVTTPNNPQRVLKKLGIFQYEVYANATLWFVASHLNLALTIDPFPKFKKTFS